MQEQQQQQQHSQQLYRNHSALSMKDRETSIERDNNYRRQYDERGDNNNNNSDDYIGWKVIAKRTFTVTVAMSAMFYTAITIYKWIYQGSNHGIPPHGTTGHATKPHRTYRRYGR